MPLFKFDIQKGRTEREIEQLLDVTHDAMVEALGVPSTDRYQIVNQHSANELKIKDTGLGLKRTKNIVVITIISNKRTQQQKQHLYQLITARLALHCDIATDDVMFALVENTDADWSFGQGEAQFITGKL
ncbi:tautomerase family protein [Brochothrix campestris]|uniref:4-oxalocrotonate tautomerase n=1 Tax=Brochothrix campestris FSL F6-1037 TaxID=1265861 RepID=W7CY92_9LIST|nr:tautomerase family protein [Brochothrix campestris]EUJ41907.1 4-oxalocrotonate tautomerase [Brochothrix campestris FSL F6-1037]